MTVLKARTIKTIWVIVYCAIAYAIGGIGAAVSGAVGCIATFIAIEKKAQRPPRDLVSDEEWKEWKHNRNRKSYTFRPKK